jgi:hypothetical protein
MAGIFASVAGTAAATAEEARAQLDRHQDIAAWGEGIMRRDVRRYLLGLLALCAEVADDPRLLPDLVRILRLVPPTLAQMLR